MCLHGPFLRDAASASSYRRPWQYLICGASMLFVFIAVLACKMCVFVVCRALRGTLHDISALDRCWLFFYLYF